MSAKTGTSRAAARKNGASGQLDMPVPEGFEVDLSGWNLGDYMRWEELNSAKALIAASVEMMMAVIRAWPFEGDPAEKESWLPLDPGQWAEAIKAVDNATGNSFRLSIERRVKGGQVPAVGSGPAGSEGEAAPGENDPAV